MIPDRDPRTFYPLRSYLRMPSASVAAEYITTLTAPGDLVVDPFASTPVIARVARSLGRRALAVESNPLWSWLAHTMATLPPAVEIDAAVARLGDALKDDIPLRTHINRMYETTCSTCHQLTPADYFMYVRDVGPVQRHYTCVHCGETKDESATEDDLKRAAAFDAHGLHYHFALGRVVPAENLHAERLRKMLDLYTPRNLDALVTLTVKIDSLFHATRERDLLLLLLLHLLDRGSGFYTESGLEADGRVAAHKQFVEFNLWREMEKGAHALANSTPEPIADLATTTGEVVETPAPRVFLGRGSAKALARSTPEECVALILTAPPVRRLGVWALSYFWGAWILGRAAVESLIPSLDPHKNEPNWERRWYFDLLAGSMEALAKTLRNDAYAIFAFDESWQEVIEALLLSAAGARLELDNFVFQPRRGDDAAREFDSIPGSYRIILARRKMPPLKLVSEVHLAERIRTVALAGCREVLTRRGEPLAYSWIHNAAYTRAYSEGLLAQVMSANTKVPPLRFVFYAVREGLAEGYAHDLDHFSTGDQFVWLRHSALNPPLIDRVDEAVRALLQVHPGISQLEMEDLIYRDFPGDLTPEAGLIELCARTFAEEQDGKWHLRAEDLDGEKERVLGMLSQLGNRLDFRVRSGAPFDLIWEADGEIAHAFVWRERARWDDLCQLHMTPAHGYLILPETRIELLRERVHTLPLQAETLRDAGWDFVRGGFVDKLLSEEKIERHDIALITGLVPPVAGERTQLELF